MAITRLGIDGGIAPSLISIQDDVTATIGLATESNTAIAVGGGANPQVTKFGIDGGITPFNPDFRPKLQVLQQAQETNTALAVINENAVAQSVTLTQETEQAFSVSSVLAPTITSVSSSRGTNIIAANETLTVNVSDSTGVTQVEVNGVVATGLAIITSTEITCNVPLGVGAPYATPVNIVATNSSGPSPNFPATWQPPLGMVETDFTVDYASLDPDSPFAGDTDFSAIVAGDSCIYDSVTTPGGNSVTMDGAGQFTVGGTITAVQTFNYYIYDASDNTVSASIEQITVQPGPVESAIGQTSEVDSTFSVTSKVVVTQVISQASAEVDTAFSVTDGSALRVSVTQATESDSAQSVTSTGPSQTIVIGFATESNSAFTFTDGSIPTETIGQALEAAQAFAVTDVAAVSATISQATELDDARPVFEAASLDSIQAQIAALQDSIDAQDLILAQQQLLIEELYTRMDLNKNRPNTYADDGSSIANDDFTLTKTDNRNGTFDITRS